LQELKDTSNSNNYNGNFNGNGSGRSNNSSNIGTIIHLLAYLENLPCVGLFFLSRLVEHCCDWGNGGWGLTGFLGEEEREAEGSRMVLDGLWWRGREAEMCEGMDRGGREGKFIRRLLKGCVMVYDRGVRGVIETAADVIDKLDDIDESDAIDKEIGGNRENEVLLRNDRDPAVETFAKRYRETAMVATTTTAFSTVAVMTVVPQIYSSTSTGILSLIDWGREGIRVVMDHPSSSKETFSLMEHSGPAFGPDDNGEYGGDDSDCSCDSIREFLEETYGRLEREINEAGTRKWREEARSRRREILENFLLGIKEETENFLSFNRSTNKGSLKHWQGVMGLVDKLEVGRGFDAGMDKSFRACLSVAIVKEFGDRSWLLLRRRGNNDPTISSMLHTVMMVVNQFYRQFFEGVVEWAGGDEGSVGANRAHSSIKADDRAMRLNDVMSLNEIRHREHLNSKSLQTEVLFIPDQTLSTGSAAYKTMTKMSETVGEIVRLGCFCVGIAFESCVSSDSDGDGDGDTISRVLMGEAVTDFRLKVKIFRALGQQLLTSQHAAFAKNNLSNNRYRKFIGLDRFLDMLQ